MMQVFRAVNDLLQHTTDTDFILYAITEHAKLLTQFIDQGMFMMSTRGHGRKSNRGPVAAESAATETTTQTEDGRHTVAKVSPRTAETSRMIKALPSTGPLLAATASTVETDRKTKTSPSNARLLAYSHLQAANRLLNLEKTSIGKKFELFYSVIQETSLPVQERTLASPFASP